MVSRYLFLHGGLYICMSTPRTDYQCIRLPVWILLQQSKW